MSKYSFSVKEYLKHNFLKYLIIWIALVAVMILIFASNDTLSAGPVLFVVVIFALLLGFILFKAVAVKSSSTIEIQGDMLKVELVKFNGTSSTRMTMRYESDVYTTYSISGYRLNGKYLVVFGKIEKNENRRRNNNRSNNKKTVSSFKIPLFFENKEQIIDDIKRISGGC